MDLRGDAESNYRGGRRAEPTRSLFDPGIQIVLKPDGDGGGLGSGITHDSNVYRMYAFGQMVFRFGLEAYILYASCMATAPTIPVRLPEELLTPLDAWAKELGLSRSAAIKLCVAKQIGAVEKADAAALAALDGRKYRYAGGATASVSPPVEGTSIPHEIGRLEVAKQEVKKTIEALRRQPRKALRPAV